MYPLDFVTESPSIEDLHGNVRLGCFGLPDSVCQEINAWHDQHSMPLTNDELNELEHRSRYHDVPCAGCQAALSVENGTPGPVYCPRCVREAAKYHRVVSPVGRRYRASVRCPDGRVVPAGSHSRELDAWTAAERLVKRLQDNPAA